jgi:hypothetical protein
MVYNSSNQIRYKITDNKLAGLFSVSTLGVFQVNTNQNLLTHQNGTVLTVPVQASDSYGTIVNLKVMIQPSRIKTAYTCPRMSIQTKCIFSVNQQFDKGNY